MRWKLRDLPPSNFTDRKGAVLTTNSASVRAICSWYQANGWRETKKSGNAWMAYSVCPVLSHPVQCICLVRSLTARLFLPQEGIQPSTLEQLVVWAFLHHLASINHEDLVSIADGAESVRDDDGGLCFASLQFVDTLLHDAFTGRIESGSGLTQTTNRSRWRDSKA